VYRVINLDEVTKPGLYELTLEEHSLNSAVDDVENKICNVYGANASETPVSGDTLW
jgi:hypothetical protein